MEKAVPFETAARLVRARRVLLGIPLPDLAREMNVSPTLLAALECGRYDPRSLHLLAQRALAARLGIGWARMMDH